MDIVDRDLEKAEQDASPKQFPEHNLTHGKLERPLSALSSSTGTSSSVSVIREEMGLSAVQTTRTLERNPTALSRIETHRSQHSGTVGRSLKSRTSSKPLPAFGAGKDYPPPLPEQEEYVVEFDGPDDPLHPQNWPIRRK